MKYLFFISFISIIIIGCNSNEKTLNSNEEKTINNCINSILTKINNQKLKNCFIVNPYFDLVSQNDYYENFEDILIKKFGKKKDKIYESQKNLNEKSKNGFYKDLIKFSTCNKSNIVIKFLDISDNLVFAQLIDNYEEINIDDLNPNSKFQPSQVYLYVFVIGENGKINEVLTDGVYYD